jgi:hypothetical protein
VGHYWPRALPSAQRTTKLNCRSSSSLGRQVIEPAAHFRCHGPSDVLHETRLSRCPPFPPPPAHAAAPARPPCHKAQPNGQASRGPSRAARKASPAARKASRGRHGSVTILQKPVARGPTSRPGRRRAAKPGRRAAGGRRWRAVGVRRWRAVGVRLWRGVRRWRAAGGRRWRAAGYGAGVCSGCRLAALLLELGDQLVELGREAVELRGPGVSG